jgi:hypothetical protein
MKFVKSKFRSPWKGVVIDIVKRRNKLNPLYICLIVKDRNGNIPRKRILKTLDSDWLIEISSFDITNINNEWFTPISSQVKD